MISPRVLIVDDEAPLAFVLQDVLEQEGYDVEVCHDVSSARSTLAARRFDVALVDVFLTNEPSGLELGKHILVSYRETSLVHMTGYAEESDIRASYGNGAYACIRKPFDLNDVVRVVGVATKWQSV